MELYLILILVGLLIILAIMYTFISVIIIDKSWNDNHDRVEPVAKTLFQTGTLYKGSAGGTEFQLDILKQMRKIGLFSEICRPKTVKITQTLGDFGGDILAAHGTRRYVFQCKQHAFTDEQISSWTLEDSNGFSSDDLEKWQRTEIRAIHESLIARRYYDAHYAIVVTNTFFTQSAIDFAHEAGVLLFGAESVDDLFAGRNKSLIERFPEFKRHSAMPTYPIRIYNFLKLRKVKYTKLKSKYGTCDDGYYFEEI